MKLVPGQRENRISASNTNGTNSVRNEGSVSKKRRRPQAINRSTRSGASHVGRDAGGGAGLGTGGGGGGGPTSPMGSMEAHSSASGAAPGADSAGSTFSSLPFPSMTSRPAQVAACGSGMVQMSPQSGMPPSIPKIAP